MRLIDFINEFFLRKGVGVIFSSIIEKISGLLLVLIATHLLTKGEYGLITYASTSLTLIIPFIGFGTHQSLIRYGSISKSQINKKHLFNIVLKRGLIFSFILLVGFLLLIPLISNNLKDSRIFLFLLSFQLISFFIYEILRIYSRLVNLNKLYSKISNWNSLIMISSSLILSSLFGSIGYAIGLAFSPFIISIFFIYKLKLFKINVPNISLFNSREFLNYGLFTSLSGVLSQLLYAVDIILITNILKDESIIAQYKVSNIIPFSFLVLAVSFIKISYVKIANKSIDDKSYIKHYYLNYLKVFGTFCIFISIGIFFFADEIFLLFGKQYTDENGLIFIFTIGVIGGLLFRVPLGNILSAVGWARFNAANSFVILFLNLLFSYYSITKYGIVGAAVVTSILMWLSGILSLIAFIKFLKQKKHHTSKAS